MAVVIADTVGLTFSDDSSERVGAFYCTKGLYNKLSGPW